MTGLFPLETWVIKNLSIVYFQFINLDILKAKKIRDVTASLVPWLGLSWLADPFWCIKRVSYRGMMGSDSTVYALRSIQGLFWHLAPGEKLHWNERDSILDARGLLEIQSAPWMWTLTTSVGFCGVNILVFFCIFFAQSKHIWSSEKTEMWEQPGLFSEEKLLSALVSHSILNVTSHCFYFIFTAQIKLASC